MGESKAASLGFTDEQVPLGGHTCLIYESDEQRRRIIAQHLGAGLARGERVRFFNDETTPEKVREYLADFGVDVREAEERGAFSITRADATYCPGGKHDPPALIAALGQHYKQTEQAGYTGSRATGEMTWVLRGIPGSERFLEYEALLNTVDVKFPHLGMCQYDARRFDGATLFRVLQLHPFMVAQGRIVRNPYFVKPTEFLGRDTRRAG